MSTHHSDRSRYLYRFATPEPGRPAPEPLWRTLPRYKVLLLHDTRKDLPSIVRAVMELTRLCKDEATLKMWEAYHNGRSVLLRTYRERAELFVELFTEKGLKVALEAE